MKITLTTTSICRTLAAPVVVSMAAAVVLLQPAALHASVPTHQPASVIAEMRPNQVPATATPETALPPGLCLSPSTQTSLNWSGVVGTCGHYKSVRTKFLLQCPTGQANSVVSYWDGIGGDAAGLGLVQTVVSDNVTATGVHSFHAVAEDYSSAGVDRQVTITPQGGLHCGDWVQLITGQYPSTAGTYSLTFSLADITTNKGGIFQVHTGTTWPAADDRTVEAIAERPTFLSSTGLPYYAPLTSWGLPMAFFDLYATNTDATSSTPLNSHRTMAVTMVDQDGSTLAYGLPITSGTAPTGDFSSVVWKAAQ